MKQLLVAAVFLCLFCLSGQNAGAQYVPDYYAAPYWDGGQYAYPYAPQYDPYYELHVMHYQLYLPRYPIDSYCCAPSIVVPGTPPRAAVSPRPPAVGRR
ncbi:MAG TPA: hypothetical protein VGA73_12630 [Candidatus Binatia bacterium]